jgi:hypothetical protein
LRQHDLPQNEEQATAEPPKSQALAAAALAASGQRGKINSEKSAGSARLVWAAAALTRQFALHYEQTAQFKSFLNVDMQSDRQNSRSMTGRFDAGVTSGRSPENVSSPKSSFGSGLAGTR